MNEMGMSTSITRGRRTGGFQLTEYLPYYLAHVLHGYDTNMAAGLHEHGLNNLSWRILSMLHDRSLLTLTELARFTVLDRSFTGRVVATLEQRGLVARETGKGDRRNVRASLTADGDVLFRRVLWPIVAGQLDIALRGVSKAGQRQLIATLSRITKNVYRAAHEAPPDLG